MKNIILFTSFLSLVACSNVSNNNRKISSAAKDLTGTYLGVADYGTGHSGPNKPAMRIYFHPIESQPGKYDVIILEYVNLLKMAPKYISSNKIPIVAKKVGYLKNITNNISTYEASPGAEEGTYELRPLTVIGDKIEVKENAKPRILTLASDATTANPLAGATISSVNASEPKEIFFPKEKDSKKAGHQYKVAKLAYKAAKLESTWRKEYLKGPYLSQYYNREDVVLKLRDGNAAEFVLNPSYEKMNEEKRAAMFTNPKSAFLKGNFKVTEPRDGMFLFHSVDANDKSKAIVEGKIGLFIDIFDATKSLNQDVVELALIDAEKPEDFLMYYEDPKNGEGTDVGAPQ